MKISLDRTIFAFFMKQLVRIEIKYDKFCKTILIFNYKLMKIFFLQFKQTFYKNLNFFLLSKPEKIFEKSEEI